MPKLPKIDVERESAPEKKQTKTPYVTRESQTSSDLLNKLEKATGKSASTSSTTKVSGTSNS